MTAQLHRDEWLVPTLAKLVDAATLEDLRQSGESLWDESVRRSLTTDEEILATLGAAFRMPAADLGVSSAQARDVLSEALARKYQVVPLAVTDHTFDIAVANPNDYDCERAIGFATGRTVRMRLASPSAIAARIEELYLPEDVVSRLMEGVSEADVLTIDESTDSSDFDVSAGKESARPIIKLVDHIIAEGIGKRASDIHLELQEGSVQVTYRIDGVLRPAMTLPRAVGVPLVSRIKIMSGLDIADRLRPQDGRARVSVAGRRVDLRVSTLPASNGEKVVVRILDTGSIVLELGALGIREGDLARILHLINLREGIILVTGPTGSGKTTTLYTALKTIQTRGVNIVTVEDPVEYKLTGIVQVQVNEKAGLTFAAALRSILRQDPDVVLVGEIRDRETAGIAIQASLTGHLVLSTLHTIDASSSVARLLDIGIESYKIGAALKGVVAQRLLRRLCPLCKVPATGPPPPALRRFFSPDALIWQAAGCAECGSTGYKGRMALVEVLVADAEVERRISAGSTAEHIAQAARESGMRSLWSSGIDHVLDGNTDLDELLRVVEVPLIDSPSDARPHARAALTPPPMAAVRSTLGSGRHRAVQVQHTPHHHAPLSGDGAFELLDDIPLPVAVVRKGIPTVLLAEADSELRGALRLRLEQDGFAVVEAGDGIMALEEVDLASPDVLLLDLALPKLDGAGVLSRLRSRLQTATLPVVVITDSVDEILEIKLFEGGANDVVCKPIRPKALSARLKALTRRA